MVIRSQRALMGRAAVDAGRAPKAVLHSIRSATDAGLRYVLDTSPGIRRARRGREFVYLRHDGTRVRDPTVLRRINSLAIPPAWRQVWICADPRGHVQATGLDARGRKQYRYHPRWREVRDATKYDRMIAFGRALPKIRARVARDLARPGLPRVKILATIVRLLETTLIRVGNEAYARDNDSFGLTTMRDRHVDVSGPLITFEFRGKSGIKHTVDLHDRRLATIIKQSQELPGYELFQYVDEHGVRRTVDSGDVNAYLQAIAGEDFTAKDFRTWAGTVLAARALKACAACGSAAQAKRNVVQAIESVAKRLGNTKAVCRKCYIHPAVLTRYLDGTLVDMLRRKVRRTLAGGVHRLPREEAAVLALLQHQLAREARRAKTGDLPLADLLTRSLGRAQRSA